MSYLTSLRTYLLCLLCVGVFGTFSGVVHSAATQAASVQPTPANEHMISLLFSTQQNQLDAVKQQHQGEFEKLGEEVAEANKDIGELKLAIESQKQALDSVRLETSAVGKRVDDSLIYSNQSLDRFGLLITVLLAVAGVLGYISLSGKAIRAATHTAECWFDSKAEVLQRQIKHLELEIESAKAQMSEHVDEVGKLAEEAKVEIDRLGTLKVDGEKEGSLELSSVVEQRAEVLKDVPSNSYKFDDWNSLAFAAYKNGNLEEAAFYWLKASSTPETSDFELAKTLYNRALVQVELNQIDGAMATYDEVIHRFGNATELNLKELVAKALINKGIAQGRQGKSEAELATYDHIVICFGDAAEPTLRAQAAKALVNKGITLAQQDQPEAELATYDEVMRRFGDATEVSLREQVARALVNKGSTLGRQEELEAAVMICDEVDQRFGDAPEANLREAVAKALFNKAIAQRRLGQSEAELATYDEVLSRFGDATEANLEVQVAKALSNKGATQNEQGQLEAAIVTFDEVVRRFGDSVEADIKEQVVKTLFNKGVTQGQQGQPEAALVAYDEVVRRFGDSVEANISEQVVKALVNKGVTQGQLGQPEAALVTYDEVVRRFGDATEANIRELVAQAHNCVGFDLLCSGKALLKEGDIQGAQSRFLEALERINVALNYLQLETLNGIVMGNRAYAMGLHGDKENAELVFADALRAPINGGEELYKATLEDFKIHSIPQDDPMKELVERQWKIWQEEQRAEIEAPAA